MSACTSKGCAEPAAFLVHWPGRSSPMCLKHMAQAQGVAAAMGFDLSTEAIGAELEVLRAMANADPDERGGSR